jgi:hypothetical protein
VALVVPKIADGRKTEKPSKPGYGGEAEIEQFSCVEREKIVFQQVSPSDIAGSDSDNCHSGDKWKSTEVVDPRTAVNSPGIAHVIRMVVKDQHLERPRGLQSSDQEITDVVEISASQKGGIRKTDVFPIEHGLQLCEIAKGTSIANLLLPTQEGDRTASR